MDFSRIQTELGLQLLGEWLIPKPDFQSAWPAIACDQFTAEPSYWNNFFKTVSQKPSTAHLIFPEAYLEQDDADTKSARIHTIQETMSNYMNQNIFDTYTNGLWLTKRTTSENQIRYGIVTCVDLEAYDYADHAKTPIRASEQTVIERIPPRLSVRQNASLELSHIILLLDDQTPILDHFVQDWLAEPLPQCHHPVFSAKLYQDSGSVETYFLPVESLTVSKFIERLFAYQSAAADGLIFAVGDGNHSLATAKTHWENLKKQGIRSDHPARYAMVEILSIYDDALPFEPIHQVIFDIDEQAFEAFAHQYFAGELQIKTMDHTALQTIETDMPTPHHRTIQLPVITPSGNKQWLLNCPPNTLTISHVRGCIDAYINQMKRRTDYIHGEENIKQITNQGPHYGFLFPKLDRQSLFQEVIQKGKMPRKTFSLGHDKDKRFYVECRAIR